MRKVKELELLRPYLYYVSKMLFAQIKFAFVWENLTFTFKQLQFLGDILT